MPTWDSLNDWYKDVVGFAGELTGDEMAQVTRAQGREAQKIAAHAAAASIGGGFSGWNRRAEIRLDTRLFRIRDSGHVVAPTRASAGPWTVAERGRNQGTAGGGELHFGPGINRQTGITSRTQSGRVRRVRASRARRWNGVTQGKRTATTATTRMQRQLPAIADREVLKLTRRRFDVT